MTIKQKLKRYSYIMEQAKECEERIAAIRDRMTSISSTHFDVIPGGHSNRDKIGDAIAKLYELEGKYIDMIGKLAEEELEITNMISHLSYEERKLIRLRYIELKTIEEISCMLNYTYRHTSRLYRKIFTKLETCPKMS